jgi:hypothetical protein
MFAWFLIGVPFGYILLRFNAEIGGMFGKMDFAERVFGGGGTYTLIKFVGIFIMVFSFVYPLGGCDALLNNVVGTIVM